MKRSGGVTLAATTSLLGSLFSLILGIGIALLFILFPLHRPVNPGSTSPKTIVISMLLFFVLPGIWGFATSIGLFRLKRWSRISTITFSAILILTGLCVALFVVLLSFVIPPALQPQALSHDAAKTMNSVMAVFALAFISVGVWWAVFFNRRTVKKQFAPPVMSADSAGELVSRPGISMVATKATVKRPLSILIIAWLLLAGCVLAIPSVLMHVPVILFMALYTGWSASLIHVAYALVNIYIGVGLLRLRPKARLIAIAYYVFGFLTTITFYLTPGSGERVRTVMKAFFLGLNQPQAALTPEFNSTLIALGVIQGAITSFLCLYFLVTRKKAFMVPQSPTAFPS